MMGVDPALKLPSADLQGIGPKTGPAADPRPSPEPHRILFVSKNHLPFVGGSEVSTHLLAENLSARGYAVTVLTRLTRRSLSGLLHTSLAIVGSAHQRQDSLLGYRTVRSVRPVDALSGVLESTQPDALIVTCGDPSFASEVLQRNREYPAVLYIRDAPSATAATAGAHFDLAVANSEFVAQSIRGLGQTAVFVPSLFPRSLYEVASTREKILFVNPSPRKGLDIALFLAESRPDIPFVFSLSWRMRRAALRTLRRTASRLGNIEIRRATIEPRALFRDCRVILAPTQIPEAWCRVVSEAQINGIPCLASRIGGLPESVGPGGILVSPPGSREAWLEALAAIWDDHGRYERLSRGALEHSHRREMDPDLVLGRFETLLADAIDRHSICESAGEL